MVDKDMSLPPGAPAEPGALFPPLLVLPTCPLPWPCKQGRKDFHL